MENQNYNANYARYRKIEKTLKMADISAKLKIASIIIALLAGLSIFIGSMFVLDELGYEIKREFNELIDTMRDRSQDIVVFVGYGDTQVDVLKRFLYELFKTSRSQYSRGWASEVFYISLSTWGGIFSVSVALAFAAFILHYKVNAEYKEYSKKNELTSILLFHGFFLKVIAIQALFRVVAQFKALLPKDPYMSANPNEEGNSSSDNAQSFQKEYTSQKVNSHSFNINLTQKQGNLPALAIATGILKILYVILRITKFFVKYGSITKFLRSLSYGGIMGLFNGGLSGLLIGSIGAKLIQFILVGLWLVIFIMQIVAVVRYSKIENKNKAAYICTIVGFFVGIVGLVGLFMMYADLKKNTPKVTIVGKDEEIKL